MPRPGPRPYECVRRAWHSDRHQPMRGSIIQQIFRVVQEAHSATRKKNKEWQEKLPIVVLKAEEIMYSKANSEAEYTNLDTLWDRVNDAINTIIRREETTETGDLLPPCVEAALNLGCIPEKTSRSERHNHPRTYLTSGAQEPPSTATRVLDRTSDERRPQLLPLRLGNQMSFARAPIANSANFLSESNIHVNHNNNKLAAPRSHTFWPENVVSGHPQAMTKDSHAVMNLGSVYPLYYGMKYGGEEYQSGPLFPENVHSKMIYVGTPVVPPAATAEPTMQDCFMRADAMDTQESPREAECDLSLRLGLFSHPFGRTEKNLATETEDAGSSISQEVGNMNDVRHSVNREFCFFPGKSACDPFDSGSRMWNSGGEGQNSEAGLRKGKETFSSNEEDGQFCWQSDVPSNWYSR